MAATDLHHLAAVAAEASIHGRRPRGPRPRRSRYLPLQGWVRRGHLRRGLVLLQPHRRTRNRPFLVVVTEVPASRQPHALAASIDITAQVLNGVSAKLPGRSLIDVLGLAYLLHCRLDVEEQRVAAPATDARQVVGVSNCRQGCVGDHEPRLGRSADTEPARCQGQATRCRTPQGGTPSAPQRETGEHCATGKAHCGTVGFWGRR